MKILMLTTTNFKFHGIASVISNYVDILTREGKHNIDIMSRGIFDPFFISKFESQGCQCIGYNETISYIAFVREFRKLVKRTQYDAIHIHANSSLVSILLKIAKKNGVKIRIVHSHSTSCNFPLINKFLWKKIIKYSTKRLACSNDAGRHMFGCNDFSFVPNGIDEAKCRYSQNDRKVIREKYGIGDEYLIGHIGTFSDVKNHEFLLRIFHELKKENFNFKAIFIGDGPLKENIINLSDDLNLKENIIFAGKIPAAYTYISAMDLFVLPSKFEGLPVCMIEAQSVGVPVIYSNTISDQIRVNENIMSLPIDDHKVWANEIINKKLNYDNNASENILKSQFSSATISAIVKDLYNE